jgi:hypothetical protein
MARGRLISVVLNLTIISLIGLTLLVAGCSEERSPLAPEQELLLAPSSGNSGNNSNPNGNAVGNPHSDAEPDLNGEANGNPHINEDTNADPKARGHAVGNPHLDEDTETDPNGKATGNPHLDQTDDGSGATPNGQHHGNLGDPPGQIRSRGAVKMLLLPLDPVSAEDGFGWVLVNTTVDICDDDGEPVNGILITRVHLKAGEAEQIFDVEIVIDEDGVEGGIEGVDVFTMSFPGELVTNIRGNGNAKTEIDLDVLAGFIDNADVIYVKVLVKSGLVVQYDTGSEYVAVPLKGNNGNN